jgi:hypothetical protein
MAALKPFDSVVYRPAHVTDNGWDPYACLFHGEERGVVKRIEGDAVFVWFNAGDTAAACRRADLHEGTRELRAPEWFKQFEARHV